MESLQPFGKCHLRQHKVEIPEYKTVHTAHEVVSERFHNSQNENDMNCRISHPMQFLVFVLRGG